MPGLRARFNRHYDCFSYSTAWKKRHVALPNNFCAEHCYRSFVVQHPALPLVVVIVDIVAPAIIPYGTDERSRACLRSVRRSPCPSSPTIDYRSLQNKYMFSCSLRDNFASSSLSYSQQFPSKMSNNYFLPGNKASLRSVRHDRTFRRHIAANTGHRRR